jgi:hypothetical protein
MIYIKDNINHGYDRENSDEYFAKRNALMNAKERGRHRLKAPRVHHVWFARELRPITGVLSR